MLRIRISLACLAFLAVSAVPSFAQTTFGEDVQVTSANNTSQSPQFDIDSEGNFHLVWMDQRTGRAQVYYAKLDNDGAKLVSDVQVNNGLFDTPLAPHVAVDGNDFVHIIWSDRRDGNNEIYYEKRDIAGVVVVDDLRVTNDTAFTEPAGIVADAQGNLHVVFVDQRDGNYEVYYKRLDNSGSEIVADTRVSNDPDFSQEAQIALDLSTSAHIVWQDSRGGGGSYQIFYSKISPAGSIAVAETPVTVTSGSAEDPDLVVDTAGNIHLVWDDTRDTSQEIYYKKLDNSGGELLADQRVSDLPDTSLRASITLDSNQDLAVVWRDRRGGDDELYLERLDRNGMVLESDTRVTQADGQSAFPVIRADASRELYVVWQDDRDGDLEIFFKRSFRCKTGTVDLQSGSSHPVLFVNGQIGDLSRTVYVPEGYPVSVAVQKPPAGSSGNFVIHADTGVPLGSGQVRLPAGVGTTCFDFLIPPSGSANPAGVWNNIGFPESVGASQYLDGTPIDDPAPAPTVIVSQILGDVTVLPVGASFTFQGIIKDQGSTSAKLASTTNAVILKIL
jgi:hypothetical protein